MIQNNRELQLFLFQTKTQIDILDREFKELSLNINHNRECILRILHTIKGGAATFSFKVLKEAVHLLEKKMTSTESTVLNSADVLALKQTIDMESMRIINSYSSPIDELALQKDWTKNFSEEKSHFQPVKNLISPFPLAIEKTAQLLGKSIRPLIVKNGTTPIPYKVFDSFFSAFIHVLRNSVDHGIESPKMRHSLGKNLSGTLSLDFFLVTQKNKKYLQIKYRDDGQGINPSLIRAKLIQNKIAQEHLSDCEVINYIFNPSFSTRNKVTETSGYGIGLNAVKYEVDILGGSITVNTEIGHYTEFVFLLPYPELHASSGTKVA